MGYLQIIRSLVIYCLGWDYKDAYDIFLKELLIGRTLRENDTEAFSVLSFWRSDSCTLHVNLHRCIYSVYLVTFDELQSHACIL